MAKSKGKAPPVAIPVWHDRREFQLDPKDCEHLRSVSYKGDFTQCNDCGETWSDEEDE